MDARWPDHRAKIIILATVLAGLLPIMWNHRAGADVMKRIAGLMVGGGSTSFFFEFSVYPVIFHVWRAR